MPHDRRTARLAGVLYLVTHVTSVLALALYGGVTAIPAAGRVPRAWVVTGALLEVVLALAVVGTAVVLHPLLRRSGELAATAYVGLRTLEASVILVGVVTVLASVARPASTAPAGLDAGAAQALTLVHDWTFLVGPGLVVPVHTVVLARLLRRKRLVPAAVPVLGIVGAVLIGGVNLAVLYGADVVSVQPFAAVPIFAWELALAVTLLLRGLRPPTPGTPTPTRSATPASMPG